MVVLAQIAPSIAVTSAWERNVVSTAQWRTADVARVGGGSPYTAETRVCSLEKGLLRRLASTRLCVTHSQRDSRHKVAWKSFGARE